MENIFFSRKHDLQSKVTGKLFLALFCFLFSFYFLNESFYLDMLDTSTKHVLGNKKINFEITNNSKTIEGKPKYQRCGISKRPSQYIYYSIEVKGQATNVTSIMFNYTTNINSHFFLVVFNKLATHQILIYYVSPLYFLFIKYFFNMLDGTSGTWTNKMAFTIQT